MIAIGGAIGTGLFLALGGSLSQAGPGGVLVAYGGIAIMVFFLMTSLGEMSTYMPVSGSFETYATKFVDPAVGFALGWNYWYNWAITVAAELAAGVLIIQFWLPDANPLMWSAIFLVLLVLLNYFSVTSYGESEFWFAGIKVVTIIVFLIIGILMILGVMGGHSPGFENWHIENAPFNGGFFAVISIFMIAGFSFQGTELIGIAAGEAQNPQETVPRAIKTVFIRIMLFYIGAILIIGFLLPYTDPQLLGANSDNHIDNILASPFTIIFQRAGLAAAASVMNAVILTSVLSCGNSGMYASTRMLYSMAVEGKAPKIFSKVNKKGIPVAALLLTAAVGMGSFLGSLVGKGEIYLWLVNASGVAGFIAWLGIALSHYKFRKAFVAQGHSLSELKYKALLFPVGPIIAMALCIIVVVVPFFLGGIKEMTLTNFLVSYLGAIFVIVLYIVYKVVKKTKWIKAEDADLSQGFAVEKK
jgi:lysine-specific permease